MKFKHQKVVKLCLFTDVDFDTASLEERMKEVEKAIKEKRFYLEMIPKEKR